MKIGLISNERSHANKTGGALADRAPVADDLVVAKLRRSEDQDRADLIRVLQDFAAQDVGLIVIDGGDGTIRDILSRIDLGFGADWPRIALVPSGKTNAIAADVGHSGKGIKALERILHVARGGDMDHKTTGRSALEIDWNGRDTTRGFLFGYGAFTEGVRFANEQIHPAGVNKGLAVVLSAAGAVRRSLAGRHIPPDQRGTAARLAVDGQCVNDSRSFVMLASTLTRLTPGIRPFWTEGAGDINWLDVAAPLQRGLSGLSRMVAGRPRPWMREAGYQSGRAWRLDVSLKDPFILDGEVFEATQPIAITASQPIRFVRA